MADLTERLYSVWSALSGQQHGDGWRTIPLDVTTPCQILAGRRFPGDEEAVLVGFRLSRLHPLVPLPEGRGFRVERPKVQILGESREWFSLSRQGAGSLEMFTAMVCDVIALLESSRHVGDDRLCQVFVGRICAWQEFMERGRNGVLTAEAEVGLFGELIILTRLIELGIPAAVAIDFWQGPMRSIQDFEIGPGAIEVKTTIAASGFPATIGSLEQLDDAARQPLFVAGVRLAVDKSGVRLTDLIASIRQKVREQTGSTAMLDNRLLQAGFFDDFSGEYERNFLHIRTRILPVDGNFPRLVRGIVPPAVTRACYMINLDLVDSNAIDLVVALKQLAAL